jgi:hypothetical protein
MYWVTSFYLKEHKAAAYQEWLQSEEARQLQAAVEEETGMRFVDVYWPILGFGEYDCESWWEVPDWAALDAIRISEAIDRMQARLFELDFFDGTRGQLTRMMRTTADVRIQEPPEG